MNQDLHKLTIRTLSDDRFCIINYDGFELLVMKYNNYVNATKMCNLDNKRYEHWSRNKGSEELIEEVFIRLNGFSSTHIWANQSNNTIYEPVQAILGSNEIKGTYVHQLLVPHILSWLSPKFAIRVSEIINKYLVDEKDRKIFDLEELNRRMEERHQETKSLLLQTRTQNEELSIKVDISQDQIQSLKDSINTNNHRVSDIQNNEIKDIKKIVPSIKPLNGNASLMILIKYTKLENEYYCIRTQKKYRTTALNRFEFNANEHRIIFEKITSNANMLFSNWKIDVSYLTTNLNHFSLNNISEEQFLKELKLYFSSTNDPIINLEKKIDTLKIEDKEEDEV